jgi:hypothetical protein
VDEELAGEIGQAEAGADVLAVDGEAAGAGGECLFPLGEDAAVFVEEAEPEGDVLGAVAGPVIGAGEAGGEPVAVAEEGVVGGEVEAVEIGAAVGEEGFGEFGGANAAMRAVVRPASNAVMSRVAAVVLASSVTGWAWMPARVVPRRATSCT